MVVAWMLRNAWIPNEFPRFQSESVCFYRILILAVFSQGVFTELCPDPHFAQCFCSFQHAQNVIHLGTTETPENVVGINVFDKFPDVGAKALKAGRPATRPAGPAGVSWFLFLPGPARRQGYVFLG